MNTIAITVALLLAGRVVATGLTLRRTRRRLEARQVAAQYALAMAASRQRHPSRLDAA